MLKTYDIPDEVRREIRKISSVAAFASDATADTVQFSTCAIAASMTVRCNTWLHHWDMDAAAQSKVVSIPFKGEKLFGEVLELLLVETKRKKKALPMQEKTTRPQSSQSGRPFCSNKPRSSGASSSTAFLSFRHGSRQSWQCKSSFKPWSQPAQQFTPQNTQSHSA